MIRQVALERVFDVTTVPLWLQRRQEAFGDFRAGDPVQVLGHQSLGTFEAVVRVPGELCPFALVQGFSVSRRSREANLGITRASG